MLFTVLERELQDFCPSLWRAPKYRNCPECMYVCMCVYVWGTHQMAPLVCYPPSCHLREPEAFITLGSLRFKKNKISLWLPISRNPRQTIHSCSAQLLCDNPCFLRQPLPSQLKYQFPPSSDCSSPYITHTPIPLYS
ncbi:hypothetical protein KIL84_004173 [Mauremys mutica]|uniref:Uncharacterized protein n=1 Tax=Mauremys mutica TaxID=74926 RepID=A0A9D3XMN8_9SAUR|nr:hypothetical protein KIL84_004173 [Mauremys mutica]